MNKSAYNNIILRNGILSIWFVSLFLLAGSISCEDIATGNQVENQSSAGCPNQDYPPVADKNLGACSNMVKICDENSNWIEPDYTQIAEYEEVEISCDNIDNDCDGQTDAGCNCPEGETRICGTDIGECKTGIQTCEMGAWSACSGWTLPAVEVCNGLDDNCNYEVDENFTVTPYYLGEPCDSDDSDLCSNGTYTCNSSGDGVECVNEDPVNLMEICDGIEDDNCDGSTDEGCDCVNGDEMDCGSDVGECALGTQTCVDGSWGSCTGGITPIPEECNGLDDNCDTFPDNGLGGASCDTGLYGICQDGTTYCNGTNMACQQNQFPTTETCNYLDDDCNDIPDDGLTLQTAHYSGDIGKPLGDSCGVGVCAGGTVECFFDGTVYCTNSDLESMELCDATDNDCDGLIDEDYLDGTVTFTDLNGTTGLNLNDSCGVGACAAGVVVCGPMGDTLECSTHANVDTDICDSMDNDCDGMIDEDFIVGGIYYYTDWNSTQLAKGQACGTGACAFGAVVCNIGGTSLTCDTLGNAAPETCGDLQDNDCDGVIDNGCK
jgi:hypothetical protein